MTDLKIKILHTLEKNKIHMIPKWKFILYSALCICGAVFAFLIAVFFCSLILFLLSNYGLMYMPFFGIMATIHALRDTPFALLVVTFILLMVSEILTKQFAFSFRRPLAITLLSFTFFAALASFIISQTSAHDYIHAYAKNNDLGMLARAYDRPRPFKDIDGISIIRGEVTSVSTSSFSIKVFDGATVTVYASTTQTQKVLLPKLRDDVIVFGVVTGERFEINAVRLAPQVPFGRPFHEHIREGKFEKPPHEIKALFGK
jgi:hypothetical protein